MRSLTDFKSKKSEKTASVFLPHLLTNLILFCVKNRLVSIIGVKKAKMLFKILQKVKKRITKPFKTMIL